MSRRFITVLYEDQLAAKPTNYGPHILLLACAADSLGGDGRSLAVPSFERLVRRVCEWLTVEDVTER